MTGPITVQRPILSPQRSGIYRNHGEYDNAATLRRKESMTLEHMIDSYGYLALVVGTFLEGETVLVLGGLAAKLGYLKLPWVIASAFLGTLMGDQLFFFLGRRKGQAFLLKRPKWHSRAEKVHRMLERHPIPIIIGFRFLYGFRTVTPFVLGMSRVPITQFVLLNIVGAAAWAAIIGGLGYVFG